MWELEEGKFNVEKFFEFADHGVSDEYIKAMKGVYGIPD